MADNNNSSMIVAIVAIIVIVALGFLALRAFSPAGGDAGATGGGGTTLDVDVGTTGGGAE